MTDGTPTKEQILLSQLAAKLTGIDYVASTFRTPAAMQISAPRLVKETRRLMGIDA